MQYKGMTFRANKNGTYSVSADKGRYKAVCETFEEATNWIWNMADNHDIADELCHRICDKFKCTVWGEPYTGDGYQY